MTIAEYKQTSYYTLEPDAHLITPGSGDIPIEEIATRVYGKPYSSLHGCQRDKENLPNDSVALYHFADEGDYEEALGDFDDTGLYLGLNEESRNPVYKNGMTEVQYWLSIKIAERPEDVTIEANPPAHTDLEGAVFESLFFADRAFAPSLRNVIADLIRRGELPRGNYIYRHRW